MHGLGPFELLIVLVIVVIFFGVGRLGEVGGALGKAIREFRKAASSEEEQLAERQGSSGETPPPTPGEPTPPR